MTSSLKSTITICTKSVETCTCDLLHLDKMAVIIPAFHTNDGEMLSFNELIHTKYALAPLDNRKIFD